MKSILIISALELWSMGEKKGAPSLWQTLQGYARHDWNVFFLTSGKSDMSRENLHSNIRIISINSIRLQRTIKRKRISFIIRPLWWLSFQIKMYRQASQIAKSEEIDLFYGYEIYGTPIAKRLSRKFGKPCISRFQGTILTEKMTRPLWRLRHWHHYIGLKVPADLIIMTDDGTQGDKVLSRLGADKSKIRFWMNGVNREIFDPNFNPAEFKKSLHIPEQTKILLSVSRLVRWKRVDRIIEAMSQITSSFPNTILLIVGDGPERNKLEKLSQYLSLQDRIVFIGSLPHSKTIHFINAADIFTSLYELSNVGNPLLEAMICGRCIVTLNNGDTAKYIINQQTGILLEENNPDELPPIITRLLEDNTLRECLGKNAREFALQNFWAWDDRMDAEIEEAEKLLH